MNPCSLEMYFSGQGKPRLVLMNQKVSKIAIITGGSHGIGKALAIKLRSEGLKVVVADIREPKDLPQEVFFRQCDVTRSQEIDALYQWVHQELGVPDILVLSAGQGIKERLTEGDPDKWQRVIDTNLMGPLRCVRSFVPSMLEKEAGNVVFLSSVSANQAYENGGIYSASKTALEIVAETLRLETLPHLNVTTVAPGIVDTSFFQHQYSDQTGVDQMDMGYLQAEDVAEDIWFALSKKPGSSINKIVCRPTKQSF